jgi:hypothetical protein
MMMMMILAFALRVWEKLGYSVLSKRMMICEWGIWKHKEKRSWPTLCYTILGNALSFYKKTIEPRYDIHPSRKDFKIETSRKWRRLANNTTTTFVSRQTQGFANLLCLWATLAIASRDGRSNLKRVV